MGFYGLGFRVWDLRCRVWDLIQVSAPTVFGEDSKVQNVQCRALDIGLCVLEMMVCIACLKFFELKV